VKRLLNVLHFRSLSGVVLISGAVLLCSSFALSQTTLTNDAVMKMATAGLGEDVIISMINTQPGSYSVTPDNLIALKKAGVSDKIIAAMVSKGSQPNSAAQPPSTTRPWPLHQPMPAPILRSASISKRKTNW